MRVWRSPDEFTDADLRTSLLSLAESRARRWLASTDGPTATGPTVLILPQARGNREDRIMPDAPEQSTNSLAVWWRLVDVLEQLGLAWQETQAADDTGGSVQVPANLAVALARSGAHGAQAAAGVATILARQADSGGRYVQLADAAQAVNDGWPRQDHSTSSHDFTDHNGLDSRRRQRHSTRRWGGGDT